MRIAVVGALILATSPAVAQTTDTSRDRRVATLDQPRDCMALWDPRAPVCRAATVLLLLGVEWTHRFLTSCMLLTDATVARPA